MMVELAGADNLNFPSASVTVPVLFAYHHTCTRHRETFCIGYFTIDDFLLGK